MDWPIAPMQAVVQAAHVSSKSTMVCGPASGSNCSVTARALAGEGGGGRGEGEGEDNDDDDDDDDDDAT